MKIRRRLFLSNMMMFLVPFVTILFIAGTFYLSYQEVKLKELGNRAVDKQIVHEIEHDLRQTTEKFPAGGCGWEYVSWKPCLSELARRIAEKNYHLLVVDDSGQTIFSNCTPLDEELLGEELQPAAFEADSAVYIFRSSNIVKYMFEQGGRNYHVIAILSRDVDSIAGHLWYIYHSYVGVIFLIGLLVFFLVNVILAHKLSRKIIQPLDALETSARAVEKGDLSVKVHTDSDEEFQTLCRHFNDMTARLLRSRQEREAYENDRQMLMAGISHDLRTPLTVIKGYIEGLRDGVATTPAMQSRYLAKIHDRTLQIERLMDRWFLYSKLNLGEYPFSFQRTELFSYLTRLVSRWQMLAEPDEVLSLVLPEETGECYLSLDTAEMERVLENLLDNARKYHGSTPLAFTLSAEVHPQEVVLRVSDNGVAVAESELKHLFMEFYRGDSSRSATEKGSGLGLAIVAQIIRAHGGVIWAERQEGLTVVMVLPREEENS